MSAPDTNVEKQARKHGIPLWGIMTSVGIAVIAAIAFIAWNPDIDDAPVAASEAAIEGASQ